MTNKWTPILPLTWVDCYKVDHRRQYAEGTTRVLSNYTNRGSRIDDIHHVVHFGLQAFLVKWSAAWEPFFEAEEDEVAALYEEFVTAVIGPNQVGSDHIRALHQLGYLPLRFCGLPEGTLVPLRVPSFTVENTIPEFFWLTNYIESVLSASYWQPSTSATLAHQFRQLLNRWALKTTGSIDGVEFQGHDFSFRGMPGEEAAAASGAGHLLSFLGSDALNVIPWVADNYSGLDNGMILGSVPATEHSVATSYGREGDQAYFEHLLDIYPSGIVSAVSDSYDLWETLTVTLPALKERIMARDGKLVIRPDSGDPVNIVTGTVKWREGTPRVYDRTSDEYIPAPEDYQFEPAQKGVVELLWDEFGGTVNEQGYKVLDPHLGVIYGDAITYERAEKIMERLAAKGFASTNIVFGVGSYIYQYKTRDTFGSAIKATWIEENGVGKDIYKDPITDNGTKKSARGRVAVIRDSDPGEGTVGDLVLFDGESGAAIERAGESLLQPVWKDGQFVQYQSYQNVREVLAGEFW